MGGTKPQEKKADGKPKQPRTPVTKQAPQPAQPSTRPSAGSDVYVHKPTGLETDQIGDAVAKITGKTGRKPTKDNIRIYFSSRNMLSESEQEEYDEVHGVEGNESGEEEDETGKAVREQQEKDEADHQASTERLQTVADNKQISLREDISKISGEKRLASEALVDERNRNRERERREAGEKAESAKELQEAKGNLNTALKDLQKVRNLNTTLEKEKLQGIASYDRLRKENNELKKRAGGDGLKHVQELEEQAAAEEEARDKIASLEEEARVVEERRKAAVQERGKWEWQRSAEVTKHRQDVSNLDHEVTVLRRQLRGVVEDLDSAQNDKHGLVREKLALETRVENWESMAEAMFRQHPDVEPTWTTMFGPDYARIRQVRRALEDNDGNFSPDAREEGNPEETAVHTLNSIGRHQRASSYLTSEAMEQMVALGESTQQNSRHLSRQFVEMQAGMNELLRVLGGRQVLNIHNRYTPGERENPEGETKEDRETKEAREDLRKRVQRAPRTVLPELSQQLYDRVNSSSRSEGIPVGEPDVE